MKFLKRIFRFFFKEKIVYSYDVLIRDHKAIVEIVLPDILSYNKNIEKILNNNNLLEDTEYKFIPKINAETTRTNMLYSWCTDHGRRLEDVNKEIQNFLRLSDELIKQFNTMKRLKQNDNLFKFNIRQLQPYIINLENIRGVLTMK